MSSIICTATECKWHDAEADACSKGTIFVCPTFDSTEPAYCDSYEDSLAWIEDKAIHTLYEQIGNLYWKQPYRVSGRYLTYYAENKLYLVFDIWYHGFFLVEAKSPKDAIEKVNCDQLAYLPKGADDE